MKLKKIVAAYLFVFATLAAFEANSQTCNKLPNTFKTYEQAKSLVESSSFKIKESVNTSKSSWIRCARYYSCDGNNGFFVFCTEEKEYMHKEVPLDIWVAFKNASSFGKYYNSNIKGKYRLVLE